MLYCQLRPAVKNFFGGATKNADSRASGRKVGRPASYGEGMDTQEGKISFVKIGRAVRIPEKEIERIQENTIPAKQS